MLIPKKIIFISFLFRKSHWPLRSFSTSSNIVTESVMSTLKNYRESRFVDRIRLKITAGSGGKGCVSYHRDRIIRSGAPDGGDGGKGGDFYFIASPAHNNFHMIKRGTLEGNDGKSGGSKKRDGRCGKDIYYSVPIGTLVYEILAEKKIPNTALNKKDYYKKLLLDLDNEGKSVLVAKGGAGGQGNSKHRGVKVGQTGKPGQVKTVYLELKSLADVGLVGLPNVGKSTILASISRSMPKIANYPFTTLNPMIGKIRFLDNFEYSVADIPGIIEDAHLNKGLGLDFLRHIERTKILMYVLDVSWDESPLMKQLTTLENELLCYRKDFLDRPAIVAVNKCDGNSEAEKKFEEFQKECKYKSFLISAKLGYGIGDIVKGLRKIIEEGKQKEEDEKNAQKEQIEKTLKDKLMLYS